MLSLCPFLLLLLTFILRSKYLLPLKLYFFVWTIFLGFYDCDRLFFKYQFQISSQASNAIIISLICFFLGGIVAVLLKKKDSKIIKHEFINYDKLYKITLFLVAIFSIVFIFKMISQFAAFGNPFENLSKTRIMYVKSLDSYNSTFVDFLVTLFGYITSLNIGVLIGQEKPTKKNLFLACLIMSMIFIIDLSRAGRSWFFATFILMMSGYMSQLMTRNGTRKIETKKIMKIVFVIAAVFIIIAIPLVLRSEGHYEDVVDIITMSTSEYIVGDIVSFSYFIDNKLPSDLPGYYTFGGIYRIADDILRNIGVNVFTTFSSENYLAVVNEKGYFNTSIDLAFYYADFGFIGIYIIKFIIGFLSVYYLVILGKKNSSLTLFLLSILLAMSLFSIRGIFSEGRYFWIMLLFVGIQAKYINNTIRIK